MPKTTKTPAAVAPKFPKVTPKGAPGESYEYATGKTEGAVWTAKSCAECRDIRKALVCGSWEFGALWEHINPYVYEAWERIGPWDCLVKVESERARMNLVNGFNEWRDERAK